MSHASGDSRVDLLALGGDPDHDGTSGTGAPAPRTELLTVRELRIQRRVTSGTQTLVHGLSLSIAKHQTVAVVGESGSGKSLSALALTRLIPRGFQVMADELRLGTTDLTHLSESELRSIRGRRIAMVFQNPMSALNPVLTVGHQLAQVLHQHLGLRGGKAKQRAVELLELVEVPDPVRRVSQYPFEMSGGMLQRVMIAIALAATPELLIADEPTTALDTTLQAQIMELLKQRQQTLGMGVLLISHDLGVVAGAADEVSVMYAGRVVEHADVRTLFRSAAHPYTQALLKTVRDIGSPTPTDLSPIPGTPPRLDRLPSGCPFAPRCTMAIARCRSEVPEWRSLGSTHEVACHRASE